MKQILLMRNTDTAQATKRTKELSAERRLIYDQNPKLCKKCFNPLPYENHSKRDFCSHKCATTYVNLNRENVNHRRRCARCESPLAYNTKGKYCMNCGVIVNTEEAIRTGTPITPNRLRTYLKKVRGHRCEQCGLETWMGNPIPLDNHHIDGNWKNNNLDNLKLLCKNCHALTDNYGAKNNGNGRKKSEYSNIIVTNSTSAGMV